MLSSQATRVAAAVASKRLQQQAIRSMGNAKSFVSALCELQGQLDRLSLTPTPFLAWKLHHFGTMNMFC